jgi:dynein heavy chain 1
MWVSFIIDPTINLTSYIIDLQKRFEQFNKLIAARSYQSSGVWFGGLLFPEAYMTATRQFVAQRNGWSLEELELQAERYDGQGLNEESLLMTGMRIEGGNWAEDNVIVPIGEKEAIGKSLPPVLMRWRKVSSKTVEADEMMVPVYLNRTRKNLIMSLKVKCGKNKTTLYQKGIAIILWTN